MWRLLYSALYCMALPFVFPGQFIKRAPGRRALWLREKLGFVQIDCPPANSARTIWVHAVSVGEAAAAAIFVEGFLARHPGYRVVVSTITDTGRKVAQERLGYLGDKARVIYLPFDLGVFINRAIRAIRPDMLVVMETEIWPNLFYFMKRAGVPVVLVNGRISDKSFASYMKIRFALRGILRCVDSFAMQSAEYARRVVSMGGEPSRVHDTGSFKFDLSLARKVIEWASGLRRPVLVVGSTHRGEEEVIISAYKRLTGRMPLSMIIVPRHPERVHEVEDVLRDNRLRYIKRSAIPDGARVEEDVVLVDTVGELTSLYAEADIALMGGSFISHGGQNFLEPAFWGKPILTGPHMHNFPYVQEFYERGAALMSDTSRIEKDIEELLLSPERALAMGRMAAKILKENRGAVGRALDLVEAHLP